MTFVEWFHNSLVSVALETLYDNLHADLLSHIFGNSQFDYLFYVHFYVL